MPSTPELYEIAPASVPAYVETPIVLHGKGFVPKVRVYFGDGEAVESLGVFSIQLSQGGSVIAVAPAEWQSDSALASRVPGSLEPGQYDVIVVGPFGRTATGQASLSLTESVLCVSDAECTDSDPCTTSESCVRGQCQLGPLDLDADADGFVAAACGGDDCDDNPLACGAGCFPGNPAADVCDSANQDCDGSVDEDAEIVWFKDADKDGFGNLGSSQNACTPPVGFVANASDCDDDPLACGADCSPVLSESRAVGNCADGFDNDCDTAFDLADPGCGSNTPPIAAITVAPAAGDTTTVFTASGTSSFDVEDPTPALTLSWDWDGDGVYEHTGESSTHTYAASGTNSVSVKVRDTGGLVDYATFEVVIADPGELIVVTTAFDEDNPGATPAAPGGAGLSLREAIKYVDSTQGRQVIHFLAGLTISLASELPRPVDAAGVDIVGDGTVVDGGSADFDCLRIDSDNNRVFGLELRNCFTGIRVMGNDNQVSRGSAHDCKRGLRVDGTNNTIGPSMHIHDNETQGALVKGKVNTVIDNRVHGNDFGLESAGTNITFRGNEIYGNNAGVVLGGDGTVVYHNTIEGNADKGVTIDGGAMNVDFVNNTVTNSGGDGIEAKDANFVNLDFTVFNGNAGADCSACTPGPGSLFVDPGYIDPATNDLRLSPQNLIIDAGTDLGIDVNGLAPGHFNNNSPDPGAWESP